jgi:hypothetical protein
MSAGVTDEPTDPLLRRLSWLVQLQGASLCVLCLAFAAYAPGHHTHHGLGQAELLFVVGLIGGIAWLVAGRALGRGARAAYSPLLLLELICLPVAWGLSQSHRWGYAIAVGLPAAVVVIALFSPVGRRVLTQGHEPPD